MKNTLSGSLNALFKNRPRFQTGTASRHKKKPPIKRPEA